MFNSFFRKKFTIDTVFLSEKKVLYKLFCLCIRNSNFFIKEIYEIKGIHKKVILITRPKSRHFENKKEKHFFFVY